MRNHIIVENGIAHLVQAGYEPRQLTDAEFDQLEGIIDYWYGKYEELAGDYNDELGLFVEDILAQ